MLLGEPFPHKKQRFSCLQEHHRMDTERFLATTTLRRYFMVEMGSEPLLGSSQPHLSQKKTNVKLGQVLQSIHEVQGRMQATAPCVTACIFTPPIGRALGKQLKADTHLNYLQLKKAKLAVWMALCTFADAAAAHLDRAYARDPMVANRSAGALNRAMVRAQRI